MAVGEAVLGAFVQVVLQNLYSVIDSKITAERHLGKRLEQLKTSLDKIHDILADEEKSQAKTDETQAGLRHLRDVAYEANDVLDEISWEHLRQKSIQHLASVRKSLRKVNPIHLNFERKMGERVTEIIGKIDCIRKNNGLRPPESGRRLTRTDDQDDRPTTGNLPIDTPVFGRNSEIDNLVRLLLTDEYSTKHISVIPVQGIGGIGKTILAQSVYNHPEVCSNFQLKMWVHVPYGSDAIKLTKLILNECVPGRSIPSECLNGLQRELTSRLTGTRYLVVLDNMWNERSEDRNRLSVDWDELQKPLLAGARGSKILITTRNPTTATTTSTVGHPLPLYGLTFDDCWEIFRHHAFEDPDECTSLPDLAVIGMKIVSKCGGSPLAARTLGRHLRAAHKSTWERIESSEILHLPQSIDGILMSLESTYHQLPPHLKQCFRFCGIFPQDFKFERDVLIRLWMAHGFILPRGRPGTSGEQMEDIGAEYFDSLVQRLFLKPADGDPSRYVMCGLISEFAQFVSYDECYMLFHHNKSCREVENIRHSSLVCHHLNDQGKSSASSSSSNQPTATIELLYKTKGLQTLLLIGDTTYCSMQIPRNMAEKLPRLRVLDLGYVNIERLDDSIGQLIHLRYLNLSRSRIKSLPESICSLYNLQTLALRNCTSLQKLPEDIKCLSKLRHLDLHLDSDFQSETVSLLSSMPKDIGTLDGLQTLSRFVVGEGRNCGGIEELGNLNDIHGDLRLLELHNIHHVHEAKEANLSNKKFLTRLELQWGANHSSKVHNGMQEMVLTNLQAHTNLKVLWLVGYAGTSFPPWISCPSFSELTMVKLSNCRSCKQLPPLGQLPSLMYLWITDLDSVEFVNSGFCGGRSIRFPRLRELCFERMRNWKWWSCEETCNLPCLRKLVIKDCPLLRSDNIFHPFPLDIFCN